MTGFPVAWAPTFATDRLARLHRIVQQHGLRCGQITIPGDPRAPIRVTVRGDDVQAWRDAAGHNGPLHHEDRPRERVYRAALDFPGDTVLITWRLPTVTDPPYDGPEPDAGDYVTGREADRQADVEMQRRIDQDY